MNTDQIEIFLAANEKYAQHLCVTIASILKNAGEESLSFNILDSDISDSSKEKIDSLSSIRDFDIKFVKTEYLEELGNFLHISKDAYSRILIPELFPNLQKALYLDCDIVVRDSLLPLWNQNINSYAMGAALDIMNYVPDNDFFSNRIKVITGSLDNFYINSGVLLMNLEYLRQFGLKEKFLEYAKVNHNILRYGDQDILNGLFVGKIRFVDQAWNYDGRFGNALDKEPKIIHFTTGRKPWLHKDVPFYNEYEKYLKLTPWCEELLVSH